MQCPLKIVRNGNSPEGNYLMVQFDKTNYPAKVRVVVNGVPTEDIESTNGKSGVWTSNAKYSSTQISLQLLDASGNILNTCSYDVSGQPLQTTDIRISNAKAVYSNGNVNVSWHSDAETGLKAYLIERTNLNLGSVDKTMLVSALKGAGQDYLVVDNEIFDDISLLTYSISANLLDNSTKPLAPNIPVTQ